MLLNSNGRELGQCPFCNQTTCLRWIAVQAHFHDRNTRDAAREARRLGICRSAGTRPCLHHLSGTQCKTSICLVLQRPLVPKKTLLDNFKRAILEAKHVNEFRPDDVLWEKISKGLLRNPDRFLKNTDKRMVYIYNNMFFVKKDFTFGFRTVKSGEIHLIQTTHVPMLIYELPASSLKCRAQPNVIRRSFEPHDQMLYHRTILEPHTAYPIPAGTHYTVLTLQKTVFGLDIIPEMMLPSSWRMDLTWGILDKGNALIKRLTSYLLRPRLMHLLRQTNDLWNNSPSLFPKRKEWLSHPSSDRLWLLPRTSDARSTCATTPQILLPDPPLLTTPQILVSDPPVPTTPQILLPDPPPVPTTPQILLPDPPVVKTLEPTFTDDSSVDQILSSVFGDYLQQGIPLAHTQEPQVLDTVPSLFDESNDLISFLDHFEAGLAIEQQETPMDLTMPRMKKKSDKQYWI
ncbi:integrase catalytic domain-containing protein [Trichonephila clavipes]|nr:integrase catalytic domain-containing protein [Trichonephila clavipes]